MRSILMSGVGYPPHSVKLSSIMGYVRLTIKHPSNAKAHPHRAWVPPTLGQTQHYNVLHTTYRKTSKQRWRVIHTGVGYPPHSVKLNTITCYVHDLPQNIRSTTEGHPHRGWVPSTLGQTQHCNVLCTTYLKTSEQQQKVIHIRVGYPPHSVKLNTVMRYA